jgi:hypothetical protein
MKNSENAAKPKRTYKLGFLPFQFTASFNVHTKLWSESLKGRDWDTYMYGRTVLSVWVSCMMKILSDRRITLCCISILRKCLPLDLVLGHFNLFHRIINCFLFFCLRINLQSLLFPWSFLIEILYAFLGPSCEIDIMPFSLFVPSY